MLTEIQCNNYVGFGGRGERLEYDSMNNYIVTEQKQKLCCRWSI